MKLSITSRAIINGKHVHKLAWERAKKYKAIPNWSRTPKNRRKILKIYIGAQTRNLTSKIKFEVDHIIPLYHQNVCGLHVVENLQVLSKDVNQLKSNEFYSYRELNGRRYYYGKPNVSQKSPKIPKKYNRTKKNPLKMVKKRIKATKSRQKFTRKKASFLKVK